MADKKRKNQDAQGQAGRAARAPKAQKQSVPLAHKETKEQASKPSQKGPGASARILTAIIVIAIVVIGVVYVAPSLVSSVPFSTFKSTFQGAARVSVTATFNNQSQYANEGACFSSLIQVIAHSRQASSIDFFIINQANSTCTYSTTGLGGSVVPATTNSSYCLGRAKSEPGIYLNYSSSNSTRTTASSLYVYGNSAYMAQCPISVEMG